MERRFRQQQQIALLPFSGHVVEGQGLDSPPFDQTLRGQGMLQSASFVSGEGRLSSTLPTISQDRATREAVIADPFGLHPGPAAQIALVSAAFDADTTIQDLTTGRGPASARSLIALGALAARKNHRLRIEAHGRDAERAVAALAHLVTTFRSETVLSQPRPHRPGTGRGQGFAMSPGVAFGSVVIISRILPAIPATMADNVDTEVLRLLEAVTAVRHDLATRASDPAFADILALQDVFLQDPALVDASIALIRSERRNAADAFSRLGAAAIEVYATFEEERLRARAIDLRDAVDAVLRHLLGAGAIELPDTGPAILLATDLSPALAHQLDPARILGVVDRRGAPTSHTAVMLKALGIPAVCGADALVPATTPSTVVFDGITGKIAFDPDSVTIERFFDQGGRVARPSVPSTRHTEAAAKGFASTRDGVVVEMFANVSSQFEAQAGLEAGALGIGLLRSEMAFLDRVDAPDENEQIQTFKPLIAPFAGRTVIIRTFDCAEDKPLPFLTGQTVPLVSGALFENHISALLQLGLGVDLRLLLPKITAIDEVTSARAAILRVHDRLMIAGIAHVWPVPIGMMVEVPAAALLAASFTPHVDFLSLGTNDLAQFTDGVSRLTGRHQPPSPAMLKLIFSTIDAAAAAHRPLSVCGELAGEPSGALLLVGLGVRSLSMRATAFSAVAESLSAYSLAQLQDLAQHALTLASAGAVEQALADFITGENRPARAR